ncbi:hypothetical protein [Gordonia sp. MP11Mi]|uniref:Uncharacterized protein n=1 Tax=Gordonia sp. MP11Mi TaxID=3022769 RepID=A0AA97D081_9ACTN
MDEDDLTPEEIDALFEQTQPIGDRIRVVAEAELIVESVDDGTSPAVQARLDATIRDITDDKDSP